MPRTKQRVYSWEGPQPREAEDLVLFCNPLFNGPIKYWSKGKCKRQYKRMMKEFKGKDKVFKRS